MVDQMIECGVHNLGNVDVIRGYLLCCIMTVVEALSALALVRSISNYNSVAGQVDL